MNSITYTKYNLNEFDLYYAIVSDDEVMKYISGSGLSVEQAQEKFRNLLMLNEAGNRYGYFKVCWDNKHIGSAKLEPYRKDSTVWELGYILKQEFWGNGLASTICQLMIDLAKELDASMDIIGIIDPKKLGSRKVLEKYGFKTFFTGIEDGLFTEKLILKSF